MNDRKTASKFNCVRDRVEELIIRVGTLQEGRSEDRQALNEIRNGVNLILEALNLTVPGGGEPAHASFERAARDASAPRLRVLKTQAQAQPEDRLGQKPYR